jgi:hypothetical protein
MNVDTKPGFHSKDNNRQRWLKILRKKREFEEQKLVEVDATHWDNLLDPASRFEINNTHK